MEQGSVCLDAGRDDRRQRSGPARRNPAALDPPERRGSGDLLLAGRLAARVVQCPGAGRDLSVRRRTGARKLAGQTVRAAEQSGRQRPVRLHRARGWRRRFCGTAGIELGGMVGGGEPRSRFRARYAVSLDGGGERVAARLAAAHAGVEAAVVCPDHAGRCVGANAGDRRRGRLSPPCGAAVAVAALFCRDRHRGSGPADPQPNRDRRGGVGRCGRLRLQPARHQPVPGSPDPLRRGRILDGCHLRPLGVAAAHPRHGDLCDRLGYP